VSLPLISRRFVTNAWYEVCHEFVSGEKKKLKYPCFVLSDRDNFWSYPGSAGRWRLSAHLGA